MWSFKIGDIVKVVHTPHSERFGTIVTVVGKRDYELIVEYPFPINSTILGYKKLHTCYGTPNCYEPVDLMEVKGTIDLVILKNLFRLDKILYVKHSCLASLNVNDKVTVKGIPFKGKFYAVVVERKSEVP